MFSREVSDKTAILVNVSVLIVEITPDVWCGANLAEDMKMSPCRHFSLQAQYFVRVGGVEVELSWQVQGIVRLRRLVEVNVAVTV